MDPQLIYSTSRSTRRLRSTRTPFDRSLLSTTSLSLYYSLHPHSCELLLLILPGLLSIYWSSIHPFYSILIYLYISTPSPADLTYLSISSTPSIHPSPPSSGLHPAPLRRLLTWTPSPSLYFSLLTTHPPTRSYSLTHFTHSLTSDPPTHSASAFWSPRNAPRTRKGTPDLRLAQAGDNGMLNFRCLTLCASPRAGRASGSPSSITGALR